ncbi:glycosyltransferase family 2 protein [uncultured Akkermansia sp.]|uniref:glycosyltransferase family 2 protein n=1 Tax=uncultured Akkermansia sp. TaxID=512294 RepID=UPI00265D2F9A|nr:glycosyltransferase family 2 protein [uncultured Akkermansia sp.]
MTAPVKISVLVPVYNVEPYLAQCLESICAQTLRELEVICVDDASTDGSLSILREFAERDPRIRVIQAPSNGGLSRTRNLAMNHAEGEYLMLVDSDDWLETDLLEEMYGRAKALDADKLVCGFRYYYESDPDREDRFLPEDVAAPDKGWIPCNPETIGKIHHGAGGMMIRRSIVEEYGIRFPEGVTCEDLYFHYVSFPRCRRICVVSRAAYVYRKRSGSITSGFASGSSLQSLDYLTVARLVLEEWKQSGILEEYREAFLKMLVMGVRNIRKYAPHAVQKEVTRKVSQMLRRENLYRPGEGSSSLSLREDKLLKTWLAGKSGLDFSYYWKRMRKAAARMLRR